MMRNGHSATCEPEGSTCIHTYRAGRERRRQECECVLMGIIWRWKTNGTAVGLQLKRLTIFSKWIYEVYFPVEYLTSSPIAR